MNLPVSGDSVHSKAFGDITPIIAFVVTLPPLFPLLLNLRLHLGKIYVMAFRAHLDVSEGLLFSLLHG